MNLDKILQRIRLLFKEQYFYEKDDLILRIRHLKNYPIDQIYSALTFLINEKNEYITDISEYLSVEGYKFNSPDVNNPFNIMRSSPPSCVILTTHIIKFECEKGLDGIHYVFLFCCLL
jgi:hypothetical protein